MKFFDSFLGKAGNVADYAVKKGGEMTASAKLRVQIHTANAQLAKIYENLGRAYFDSAVNGADAAADIADYIKQVKDTEKQIADLTAELADLQGYVICAQCGEAVDKTFAFCPKCGAKLPDTKVETAEDEDEDANEDEEPETPAEPEQPAEPETPAEPASEEETSEEHK